MSRITRFCCRHLPGCRCYECESPYNRGRGGKGRRISDTDNQPRLRMEEAIVKRPEANRILGSKDIPFQDEDFYARYPTLWEYLTAFKWDDGKPRQTSTLLIFVDSGVLKICINDRDNNRSAFVSKGTVEETLMAMESALLEESIEWRARQTYNKGSGGVPY